MDSVSWPKIEDHSQIVRFVSSFIADTSTGIPRDFEFMMLFDAPTLEYGNKSVG